ncbi:unnamed protein product [Spirodela intermedia]|uniref:Uncharacterized protein n=1 Tax=Spirodela intermedia TaxID=51605 RepID=A0A7I8JSS0_SPIIN|nr:unnamed protein product [Spirodela intermedia]CAA6673226.1 unnamed protein product [Spirodela intermedia]
MAISLTVVVAVLSLHLLAFVFAIGAEMRRNTGKVVPDEYDERTYCVYGSDASTTYGLAAAGLLLVSHAVLNGVTGCLCLGRGLGGGRRCCPVCAYFLSWLSFLAAEACLVAGSARNAYHTKYMGNFTKKDLSSCAALRKGVFGASAALILISLVVALTYYWAYSRADPAGWQKHHNEGDMGMADFNPPGDRAREVKA